MFLKGLAYLNFLLVASHAQRFVPVTSGLQYEQLIGPLPSLFNLSDSQSVVPNYANSFWSSSFLHCENDHEYLVLSHVLTTANLQTYRASILDITDTSVYRQFTTLLPSSNYTALDFEFNDYRFGLVSDDKLGSMVTWSNHESLVFNLSFELSAPVLLNGGIGTFQWEIPSVVNEWSMPAGRTSGSIQVDGKTVAVDSSKSLTWYDRQWQVGGASNWTWFELHLGDAHNFSTKMSVWFYPSGFGTVKGFATIKDLRQPSYSRVVPATLALGPRTWTSPFNSTYALDWVVTLGDGTSLNISTTRDDQELSDAAGLFRTYEGYVEVTGISSSSHDFAGFGLVEIQPVSGF